MDGDPRQRRSSALTPRRVALAIVLVILAGLAAAVVSVVRSQPLDHVASTSCCTGSRPSQSRPMIAGDLVNRGRLAVRVTAVDAPMWIEVRIDQVPPGGGGLRLDGARPFRPFTLPPGQRRWVAFVSELPDCRPDRSATSFESARIRFDVVGVGRAQEIAVESRGRRLARGAGRCAGLHTG